MFAPVWNVTDDTYDAGGQVQGTSHFVSASGDVEDASYFDEDATHEQSHKTSDWAADLYTYAASSTYTVHGWEKFDVLMLEGGTGGYEKHYSFESHSNTDPIAGSTSDTSRDSGGSEYSDYSLIDAYGNTEGVTFSAHYSHHEETNVDADGNYTASSNSSGGGHATYFFSVVSGANTLSVTGHEDESYATTSETLADGSYEYSGTSEISGGSSFTLHVEDEFGNSLDESGTESYNTQVWSQADGSVATSTYSLTGNYTLTFSDGSTESGILDENVSNDSGGQIYSRQGGASQQSGGSHGAQAPQAAPQLAQGPIPNRRPPRDRVARNQVNARVPAPQWGRDPVSAARQGHSNVLHGVPSDFARRGLPAGQVPPYSGAVRPVPDAWEGRHYVHWNFVTGRFEYSVSPYEPFGPSRPHYDFP